MEPAAGAGLCKARGGPRPAGWEKPPWEESRGSSPDRVCSGRQVWHCLEVRDSSSPQPPRPICTARRPPPPPGLSSHFSASPHTEQILIFTSELSSTLEDLPESLNTLGPCSPPELPPWHRSPPELLGAACHPQDVPDVPVLPLAPALGCGPRAMVAKLRPAPDTSPPHLLFSVLTTHPEGAAPRTPDSTGLHQAGMGSSDGLTQQLAMTPPGGSWGKGGEQRGKNGKPPPSPMGREGASGDWGRWELGGALYLSERFGKRLGFPCPPPQPPQKATEQVPVQGEGSRGLASAGESALRSSRLGASRRK